MDIERLLSPRTAQVAHDAGFVRRALAFVIDILVLDILVTAPFTPIFAGLLARVDQAGLLSVTYTAREMGAMIIIFLIAYAYFVIFEYLLGQTVGMMVLGVRTESGIWQSAVRNSFLLPLFPFVIFWVVEPLAIIFSGRGMLERITHTRTVFTQRIII